MGFDDLWIVGQTLSLPNLLDAETHVNHYYLAMIAKLFLSSDLFFAE